MTTDKGNKVVFDSNSYKVLNEKTNKVILIGLRTKDKIYTIEECSENESRCLMRKDQENQLWHQRLGHVNYKLTKMLSKNEIVRGIPKLSEVKSEVCKACQMGKQVKKSFKGFKDISSTRPLQLIHMDLIGPAPVQSIGGRKCILAMVDDFSRFSWVAFLHAKSDALANFIRICNKIQLEKDCKIQKIRSDHGVEFENEKFVEYCDSHGNMGLVINFLLLCVVSQRMRLL